VHDDGTAVALQRPPVGVGAQVGGPLAQLGREVAHPRQHEVQLLAVQSRGALADARPEEPAYPRLMAQVPGPAEFAEHPGDHHHRDVTGGALRAATFGAMDGLVTNIALVAGVGGGGADRNVIILAGMAGLVAGAFSMALGEYASVQTQNDAVAGEVAVERAELFRHPNAEQAELVEMFEEMGLTRPTAEAVAREVHADPELALRVHVSQELGVNPDEQPSPWTAALSSLLCFAVGAVVPLVPYLLGSSSLLVALLVGAVGLFTVGAVTSRFTGKPWWFAGGRQLLFGALAAGATFLVGSLIGVTTT
jgi:VIT1/CCC1 family predicted Fe2+/Mn2+ transporter